jgi:hypothetical protein
LAIVGITALAEELPSQSGKDRLAAPESAALSAAELKVREVFAPEYATKGAAARRALAKKLLGTGRSTQNDEAIRFVLLREAKDIATESGDLETAWSAIEESTGRFVLDDLKMRTDILVAFHKKLQDGADLQAFIQRALPTVDSAIVRLDSGSLILDLAKAAARKAQNPWLSYNVEAVEKRLEALKSWKQKLARDGKKLPQLDDNPAERTTIGEFFCFELGAWEAGLPCLAQGKSLLYRKAVEADLAHPQAAAEQSALADRWWDVAEANVRQEVREKSRERACFWYARALPDLTGIARAAAEKRVAAKGWNYLSELEERDVQVAYGDFWRAGLKPSKPGIDKIFVNGLQSLQGLYMHPPSHGHAKVSYELGARFRRLEAFVALKDTAVHPRSAFTFFVEGDGKVLWKSEPISERGTAQRCSVNLSGVRTLRLLVLCPGVDTDAHTSWLEPVVR